MTAPRPADQLDSVPNTIEETVTFPVGGPYLRIYEVDGAGRVYRPNESTKLDRITLQARATDTQTVVAILKFVSRTSLRLADGFTKTSGGCPDNQPVEMATTINVAFAVPSPLSTDVCEWNGAPVPEEPFVKVVVRTKRV